MKYFKIFILLFIIGLVNGCALFDEEITDPEEYEPIMPKFAPKVIDMPENIANSNNETAKMMVEYINHSANCMMGYYRFYSYPDSGLFLASDTTMMWMVDSLMVTLKYSETDTGHFWQVYLDGDVPQGGAYDNYLLMEIEQNFDETAGRFLLYDHQNYSSNYKIVSYWVQLTEDVCYYNSIVYDSGQSPKVNIELLSSADGSGEFYLNQYLGTEFKLLFKAIWQADGTGEWWIYNTNTGDVIQQGSW